MPTVISDDAGEHDLAGPDLVGEDAGDRHRQHRADALRGEQQAGVQRWSRRGPAGSRREQQAGAEERDREQRHRDHRDRQVRGCGTGAGRSAGGSLRRSSARSTKATTSSRPTTRRDQHLGRPRRCPASGDRGDAVQEQRQARREQQHADEVEALRRRRTCPRAARPPGVDQRDDADRHVDQEDPVPARRRRSASRRGSGRRSGRAASGRRAPPSPGRSAPGRRRGS